MKLESRLFDQLEARKQDQAFRSLGFKSNLVDFSSNDYLGLASSKKLLERINAKEVSSNGATGSRLLSGNSRYIEQVEAELAHIFQSETTLIFNSGYTANLAILSTLPQKGDTILYDELSHACIKDGARLSLAKRYSFKHNDLDDLERQLKTANGNVFVVVESVYSMDGDFCRLTELVELTGLYGAYVILDEAHTTGIMGPGGSGFSGELNLHNDIFIRAYTFGKGMGIHGAAIACSKMVADYFINFARPFIYTTAPSPHSVASIQAAFEHLSEHHELQKALNERVSYFNHLFDQKIGKNLTKISRGHPIQAILIPGNAAVQKASQHLQDSGYDVRPILSPTVKAGEERLRICLHTFNTDNDISGLIDSLATLI